jgi:hypothetical protein
MGDRMRRESSARALFFLLPQVMLLMAALIFSALLLSSCGSKAKNVVPPPSQEENAAALGQMMVYRNPVEGNLNEPVDAVITGEVTRTADAGEETWVMLRVADFRNLGEPSNPINIALGSEITVRMRKGEGSASPAQGDFLEVNAKIMKSLEGAVIIAATYRKI